MNRDLDEQLNEMGGEYRAMVERMCAAYRSTGSAAKNADCVSRDGTSSCKLQTIGWVIGCLMAASMLLFAVLAIIPREPAAGSVYTVRAAPPSSEFALARIGSDSALREIIRTQRADGGWATKFLTRQNAEALAKCKIPGAKLAYRKAMRNLQKMQYE